MIWTPLSNAIDAHSSFLISSHQSLDGDCVGSQLAFAWYLKSKGKRVTCYCVDPLPQKFAFLNGAGIITPNKPEGMFDALVILDCSNIKRLGWEGLETEAVARTIINIDHHRDNTNFGTDGLNFVDAKAAAAGIVIFDFFKACGVNIPLHVAEQLYVAVMTDTGSFQFSNTSGRALRVCAELAEIGVDCSGIYEKVYASHSQAALVLHSRVWSTLSFHLGGKVCSMDMPMGILDEIGAIYSDSEGLADNTITGIGVEVGIMTKHTPEETHFSLRSKGKIDVGALAKREWGGGGHACAAGCTLKLPYNKAMPQMLEVLEQELKSQSL